MHGSDAEGNTQMRGKAFGPYTVFQHNIIMEH